MEDGPLFGHFTAAFAVSARFRLIRRQWKGRGRGANVPHCQWPLDGFGHILVLSVPQFSPALRASPSPLPREEMGANGPREHPPSFPPIFTPFSPFFNVASAKLSFRPPRQSVTLLGGHSTLKKTAKTTSFIEEEARKSIKKPKSNSPPIPLLLMVLCLLLVFGRRFCLPTSSNLNSSFNLPSNLLGQVPPSCSTSVQSRLCLNDDEKNDDQHLHHQHLNC